MLQTPFWRCLVCAAVTTSVALGAVPVSGQSQSDIETLKQQMQELMRQNAEQQKQIQQLQKKVETLSAPTAAPSAVAAPRATPSIKAAAAAPPTPDAQEAIDKALAEVEAPTDVKNPAGLSAVSQQPALLSQRVGPAQLRLIDVSFDVLAAVGSSTVGGQTLRDLQGGAHDPNQRGFTLQQGELSLAGAVDPYFIGEAHMVFTPEDIELEEAFFVTTSLPWDLQVKGGYFLTDFGRINPVHPHAWTFQDQPFVVTRMFGGDGLRSPGLEASWLAPLPWFSQLSVGMQNADEGDLTVSFIDQEVGIGGRPPIVTDVSNLSDFIYLARWANAFDVTPEISALLGTSGLYGANTTGPHATTFVYGGDATLKWRPNDNFRGWPFVVFQGEVIGRSYTAANYIGGTDPNFPNDLPSAILRDAGFYAQLTYGFLHPWAVALRGEYASGVGKSVMDGMLVSREEDPFRSDRARISPLIVYQPSEFSRLRLQYNYDNAKFLPGNHSANSVWLGIEFLYGTHPAHKY
ncbi:MAG: hypothetical protein SF182_06880 [Deltaproteobacteria bacterium]|nr:hypothetical protein [Deltaproteobacteria bacterium]